MIDLFAGIGGFSLAGDWAGFKTDIFVEREKYCQKVLQKNFPNIPIVDDIFDFNKELYEELTGKTTTDIISGGFPCQPFSLAGKRKGKEDDRYLWGEMLRIITEIRPRWVIAENVFGIFNISDGLVFETVHSDLEAENYQVQSFIIPASSKNAPHRRDRVWFVAHSNNEGRDPGFGEIPKKDGEISERDKNSESSNSNSTDVTHSNNVRRISGRNCRQERQIYSEQQRNNEKNQRSRNERLDRFGTIGSVGNATDTNTIKLQGRQEKGENGRKRGISDEPPGRTGSLWENFPTQSALCGGNDGVSNRVDRIKALGNAIVPQIAYEIFRTINEVER